MGDYIVQGDLDAYLSDAVLIQLTDDDSAGTIDTAIVDEAIDEAEGEANSYFAKQYTTPLTSVSGATKSVCVKLATYVLHSRRIPVPEDITNLRKQAIDWLKMVAKGTVSPVDDSSDVPSVADGFEATFEYEERQFNRKNFRGW